MAGLTETCYPGPLTCDEQVPKFAATIQGSGAACAPTFRRGAVSRYSRRV